MKEREVNWKLGGSSPAEGFDSPSFAAYLLQKHNTGYTMFLFEDRFRHPFCVGMTPAGIVALEINFGPKLLKYGKVKY